MAHSLIDISYADFNELSLLESQRGRVCSPAACVQKGGCPWSLCLPSKSDLLLSYTDRQAEAHLSPGGLYSVSHPSSTQATIRSKVTRLRGFYANLCTKKHGYKPVPHSKKEKKNTHFKQKPFNSLTTKLRTFPLLPSKGWRACLKELVDKHRQRKVNLFISKFVQVKWRVDKLTKCETSRLWHTWECCLVFVKGIEHEKRFSLSSVSVFIFILATYIYICISYCGLRLLLSFRC